MAATVDKEDQLSHGSSSKKGSDRLTDDFQLLFRLGDPLLDVCLLPRSTPSVKMFARFTLNASSILSSFLAVPPFFSEECEGDFVFSGADESVEVQQPIF